ncbi:hypothetical protein LPJ66_007699 [Kickxella alabastrina]|uniref:Uncharacterized protein n=1 Tax=Kickxella alabastrina TaxID=61397 RepID=A0ACC1IBY0_9FUNG|nr:hypothetical protein LPJ66_007699 [Kickxella alabastrina]
MPGTKVYADMTPLMTPGGAAKTKSTSKSIPKDPHGFDPSTSTRSPTTLSQDKTSNSTELALRSKKAWEVAMGPGKSLPMQAFMAWMSGTGVSIFSILITGMILMTPLKSIMAVQQTFAPLERVHKGGERLDLNLQKAAFVAINVAGVLFGVYRLAIMGLLPTASSDWLAFIPAKTFAEISF